MRIIATFLIVRDSDEDPRVDRVLTLKDAALIEGFDIIFDEETSDRISPDYVYDRKSFDALPVAPDYIPS